MRKLWQYLKNHLAVDFDPYVYLPILSFLGILVTINYTIDFEDNYLEPQQGFIKFLCYFIFYSIPYYLCLVVYSLRTHASFWYTSAFWIKSALALCCLSIDSSVPFLRAWMEIFPAELQYWMYKVVVNAISFIIVMLPLLIYYYSLEEDDRTVYGLLQRKFDYHPYLVILMLMLPLIIFASFNESFLSQYPMYKTSSAHEYLKIPEWVTIVGYEFAYGLDFITVEFLFRGFMVIGMVHLLGRKSVLAMAVVYCLLHFGKPAGEAVSSLAGGYVLGAIAFETRSIWGGIIVHVGIAYMMEIVSFIVLNLNDA